jgi:hypothetical protein
MALESELRVRLDDSLAALEEVVGSLHQVNRLADGQQVSVEQLSRVAASMEVAAGQLKGVLQGVGASGTLLQSAVDALKAADPRAAVDLAVSKLAVRIDATSQLSELTRGEIGCLRADLQALQGRSEIADLAQAAACERLEKLNAAKFEQASGKRKSVGTLVAKVINVAWLAASGVILGAVALLH